jgi:CRISPR-associated protein Csd1
MILQALTRYYDILLAEGGEDSDIPLPGYSRANVSYALNLSAQGELLDIFPQFKQVPRGKKVVEKPRSMTIPEQAGRSGKTPPAYFLCDNNAYVLGISPEDEDAPKYSQQRFEAFRHLNKAILTQADCAEARAVIAFLDKYDPATGRVHPVIARYLDDILKAGKANFVFMLNGSFVHKNAEICRVWEAHNQLGGDDYIGQCLVTGEIAPIATLHSIKIKGISPYQGGVALVGFNDRAYESYNRTDGQGLNSPVSKKAMLAYSKALNHLLSDENENKKIMVGSTTVVYWAESENKDCADFFSSLFQSDTDEPESTETVRDKTGEQLLKAIANKVKRGQELDEESLFKAIDGDTRFYVLGLDAPNRGRAAVRFFYSDPFKKIVRRITQHYSDLQIGVDERQTAITPYRIVNETVSKKAKKEEPAPLLAGAVFRAIFTNSPYPAALYYGILNRIRADMDDEKLKISKINDLRAAVIKAFLIRKYRNQTPNPIQEVLSMSLNEQSTIPAYVLGRLFAVLEKVQQEAIGDVNASIKDRYFTSACASPASVFPVLLRLSQHHISKAEYGYVRDNRIEAILNLLDVEKNPIPARLSLDEQGVFVLGYYHERKDLWTSKSKKSAESTSSDER